MPKENKVVIVAGGTGGHINAALALGDYFHEKGEPIQYISGDRYLDYQLFKDKNCLHLQAQALRYKNPFKLFKSLLKNIKVFIEILIHFNRDRPKLILGCGGYVCGPVFIAGMLNGTPLYIVEQNSVLGLTNKILAYIAKKIFIHFVHTHGLENKKNVIVSGNPVRPQISQGVFKKNEDKDTKNILVFGGSLGATQINQIVSSMLQFRPWCKIHILHQTGKNKSAVPENIDERYQYEVREYIDKMQEAYAWADYIIARSGASTIAELRYVKRPTVLVPYPAATDNHQWFNAKSLEKEKLFPVLVIDGKDNSDEQVMKILNFFRNSSKIDIQNVKENNKNACEIIYSETIKD